MSDLTVDAEKSPQNKITLRSQLLTARRSLSDAARATAEAEIQDRILASVRESRARSIAAYVPIGSEPGGADLPARLLAALPPGGRLLLPVLLPDNDLDWAEPTPPTARHHTTDGLKSPADGLKSPARHHAVSGLTEGPRGLLEPSGPRLGRDAIRTVDLMLVPALAVGRDGTRMGRGGGSYDRALARLPQAGPGPLIVALLHDGEDIDTVPAEPHDRPVNAVITPTGGFSRRPM